MSIQQEIKKKIQPNLPMMREKYHVKQLGIFGSYARGDQNEQSDLDILVDFDAPVGLFDFIRLENYLSEIVDKKVDLVTRRALKPIIRADVLKEVIYV